MTNGANHLKKNKIQRSVFVHNIDVIVSNGQAQIRSKFNFLYTTNGKDNDLN